MLCMGVRIYTCRLWGPCALPRCVPALFRNLCSTVLIRCGKISRSVGGGNWLKVLYTYRLATRCEDEHSCPGQAPDYRH